MWILLFNLILAPTHADIKIIETPVLPQDLLLNYKEYIELNPLKIKLGKKLFFDKNLSQGKNISCFSCHAPGRAYTINFRVFREHTQINKNPPVLFNRINTNLQGWEGEIKSIKDQIARPLFLTEEMNTTPGTLIRYLNYNREYSKDFQKIYKAFPSISSVQDAISEYIKSIFSAESRFDLQKKVEFKDFSEQEKNGKSLFENKFKCISCHSGFNFTNEKLMESCVKDNSQEGVKNYTRKYKVPTLRNLQFTGPYFHNGRLDTLDEAIRSYENCLVVNKDGLPVEPKTKMSISEKEKNEIISFLKTLNGKIFLYTPPSSFDKKKFNN